jgi:hypothetical protein
VAGPFEHIPDFPSPGAPKSAQTDDRELFRFNVLVRSANLRKERASERERESERESEREREGEGGREGEREREKERGVFAPKSHSASPAALNNK